jgi:hypothetical protein
MKLRLYQNCRVNLPPQQKFGEKCELKADADSDADLSQIIK